jgi:hypothetical protein
MLLLPAVTMPPGAPQMGIQRRRSLEDGSSWGGNESVESATEGQCEQAAPREVLCCCCLRCRCRCRWVWRPCGRQQYSSNRRPDDGAAALSSERDSAQKRASNSPTLSSGTALQADLLRKSPLSASRCKLAPSIAAGEDAACLITHSLAVHVCSTCI